MGDMIVNWFAMIGQWFLGIGLGTIVLSGIIFGLVILFKRLVIEVKEVKELTKK